MRCHRTSGCSGSSPDQEILQCVADRRCGNLRRLQSLAERFAPAGDAGVGFDFDQRGAPARDPALREGERLVQRRAQHVRPDVRDLHAMPTCGRRGTASAGRLRIMSASSPLRASSPRRRGCPSRADRWPGRRARRARAQLERELVALGAHGAQRQVDAAARRAQVPFAVGEVAASPSPSISGTQAAAVAPARSATPA